MKAGSVIVDWPAQNGGNCEYTVANRVVTTDNGVKLISYTAICRGVCRHCIPACKQLVMPAEAAVQKDGNIDVDFDDVVIRGVTVIRDGDITACAANRVSARPQAAPWLEHLRQRKPEKPASPRRKYGLMALAIILYGWPMSRQKSSSAILPCLRSPAWLDLLRGVERVSCAIRH